jgi:hypothetical protein
MTNLVKRLMHIKDNVKNRIENLVKNGINFTRILTFIGTVGILTALPGCNPYVIPPEKPDPTESSPVPTSIYTPTPMQTPVPTPVPTQTPRPTPDPKIEISGRLKICGNNNNNNILPQGIVRVWNERNRGNDEIFVYQGIYTYHGFLGQVKTDNGNFSFTLNKKDISGNKIYVRAIAGNSENILSYPGTIELSPDRDHNSVIELVPYPDVDTNRDEKIDKVDYEKFRYHMRLTNISPALVYNADGSLSEVGLIKFDFANLKGIRVYENNPQIRGHFAERQLTLAKNIITSDGNNSCTIKLDLIELVVMHNCQQHV